MKIATWNLQRPTKFGRKTNDIIETLKKLEADILVLTETNDCINLGTDYQTFST